MSVLVLNQPVCQCLSCQHGFTTHNAAPSGIREVPEDDPMLDGMRIGELVANERRKGIAEMHTAPAGEVVERYATDPNHGESFTMNEVADDWPPRLDYAEMSRMTPPDFLPVG